MGRNSTRERLEFIAKSVNGILWEADAETFEFTYVSPQTNSILGYPPEAWYENTTFWKDHIHSDDQERAVNYCHIKTQKGENHEFEYRMIHANGSEVWLKDLVTVHKDEEGNKILTGLMIDITESRNENIKKKEQIIKSYQLANIGHWEFDLSSEKVYWSKEIREILEVGEDFQLDIETVLSFYEEGHHRDTVRKVLKDTKETGNSFVLESKIITAKGNTIWVRSHGDALRENGRTTKIFGSTQDITKIKAYEVELEKLSRIARETQNVVIITDPDEQITWVNKAFEKETGYTFKEAIGKTPGELLQGPDTNPKAAERIQNLVTNQVPFTERILNYSKDGTPYWNQMTVTPIKNSSGEVIEFFSIQEVVTEQVLAKEEIDTQARRLKEAQEIASVGDWDFDVRSEQITWSDTVYSIFERDRSLPPPTYQEIAAIYKSDNFTADVEAAMNRAERYEEDYEVLTFKGNTKYLKTIGIPVTDEHGTVIKLRGIVQDISQHVRSQQNNRVLLQEVHHRVKNNLAIISGLLTLEMQEFENERAQLSFQRSINRIQSMAKVHELLYDTDDHSSIRIGKYLNQLSKIILSTFNANDKVKCDIDVKSIDLNINLAIPLGMLINELLTNSVKYAFEDGKGAISIQLKRTDNRYTVNYKDNGRGMQKTPELQNSKTLGFTIIHTLLNQLDAEYTLDVNDKFDMTLAFGEKSKGSHSNI